MTENIHVCVWELLQLELMVRHISLNMRGHICRGYDWDMWSEEGDWEINLYEHPELEPYKEEITRLVNENVEHGCCGGCI
jgi:hypothetical protein